MSNFERGMYGALGGFFVFVIQLGNLASYEDLSSLSFEYWAGTLLRLVILAVLGGIYVVVQSPVKRNLSLQLGMVPAAIVSLMISAQTVSSPIQEFSRPELTMGNASLVNQVTSIKTYDADQTGLLRRVVMQKDDEKGSLKVGKILDGLTGSPVPKDQAAKSKPQAGAFWYVFAGALLLTVFSGLASLGLVARAGPNPTPLVTGLVDKFQSTWTLGFGAVIGLIGGQTF